MAPTLKEVAAQESLRKEQEQYLVWALPPGIAEHNHDFQETKVTFASGAKIAIDWPEFEKWNMDCLWVWYPLPAELADAFSEWHFKTLFLSQEQDDGMQSALHQILTKKDPNRPGEGVYLYEEQRNIIIRHPWTMCHTEAKEIYGEWLRMARRELSNTPEVKFTVPENRKTLVESIPWYQAPKPINLKLFKKLNRDPNAIPLAVLQILTKLRREREKKI